MAKLLQILAVFCALAVAGLWFVLGANTGWSRHQIETKKTDPVTEIEYSDYQPGFIPGLDFLGAGLLGSGLIFAVGFAISKFTPKSKTEKSKTP